MGSPGTLPELEEASNYGGGRLLALSPSLHSLWRRPCGPCIHGINHLREDERVFLYIFIFLSLPLRSICFPDSSFFQCHRCKVRLSIACCEQKKIWLIFSPYNTTAMFYCVPIAERGRGLFVHLLMIMCSTAVPRGSAEQNRRAPMFVLGYYPSGCARETHHVVVFTCTYIPIRLRNMPVEAREKGRKYPTKILLKFLA